MLLRIVYTIAGVRPPWMRISVPATVRSSMLIQFSPVGTPFVFPRDAANAALASIPAGRPPPAMGRNPSGTSSLAYFRFHQKYWCSGMPFSFNRALIAIPFSRAEFYTMVFHTFGNKGNPSLMLLPGLGVSYELFQPLIGPIGGAFPHYCARGGRIHTGQLHVLHQH